MKNYNDSDQLDGLIELLRLAYAERNIKKEISENCVAFTFHFDKPMHNMDADDANLYAIAQERSV